LLTFLQFSVVFFSFVLTLLSSSLTFVFWFLLSNIYHLPYCFAVNSIGSRPFSSQSASRSSFKDLMVHLTFFLSLIHVFSFS
jgi:fatty-acid desaturase